jgi:hypothetical protein
MTKIGKSDYILRIRSLVKFHEITLSVTSRREGGFLRRLIFSHFFPQLTQSPDGSSDRHGCDSFWYKDVLFYKMVILNFILVVQSQKNGEFSPWIGLYQFQQQKGPSAIAFELKSQTKPHLQRKFKNWNPIRGRQNIFRYGKSKMAAAAILKNKITS